VKKQETDIDIILTEAACKRCRVSQKEQSELIQVQTAPAGELPLLMGDVQTDLGLGLIERRLREGV
jgi:hypothetical protein